MKIDQRTLIELLTERTGMQPEEVEEHLSELANRVDEAVRRGESLKIEGFGTFDEHEERIHFKPSDALETEINQKYAGMKPIELIGAFKEAAEEEETVSELEIKEQKEQETAEAEQPSEEMAETEGEQPAEKEVPGKEEQAEKEEAALSQEQEPEDPASFIFDKEAEDQARAEEEEVQEEKDTSPQLQPAEHKQKSEPERKEAAVEKEEVEEEKDSIGIFLTAAVIVLAIGMAGWLIYDMGYVDKWLGTNSAAPSTTVQKSNPVAESRSQSGTQELEPIQDPLAKESENEPAEQNASKSVSTEDDAGSQHLQDVAEASRQSIYGLRGGAVPRATKGYTIVVHSLKDEDHALSVEEGLKSEGYRTIILQASVQGTTYWRVGLGQFKTVADATEAVAQLPSTYRDNYFIKRIR